MPLSGMTRCIGKQVGKVTGDVVEVDVDDDSIGWGPCLRVQGQLDITKLVQRGSLINIKGNKV